MCTKRPITHEELAEIWQNQMTKTIQLKKNQTEIVRVKMIIVSEASETKDIQNVDDNEVNEMLGDLSNEKFCTKDGIEWSHSS